MTKNEKTKKNSLQNTPQKAKDYKQQKRRKNNGEHFSTLFTG